MELLLWGLGLYIAYRFVRRVLRDTYTEGTVKNLGLQEAIREFNGAIAMLHQGYSTPGSLGQAVLDEWMVRAVYLKDRIQKLEGGEHGAGFRTRFRFELAREIGTTLARKGLGVGSLRHDDPEAEDSDLALADAHEEDALSETSDQIEHDPKHSEAVFCCPECSSTRPAKYVDTGIRTDCDPEHVEDFKPYDLTGKWMQCLDCGARWPTFFQHITSARRTSEWRFYRLAWKHPRLTTRQLRELAEKHGDLA